MPPSSSPVMEFDPPDIGAYRFGNRGIDYVTTLTADVAGPHVVINALTHGNELCGAVALSALFASGIRPTRGRLTLVFANVEAYRGFDPDDPYASRYVEEDFNRLWTAEVLGSSRVGVELDRARELLPIYETADILLDIHSMSTDTAPLLLCGTTDRGRALARSLGYPVWVVADTGHRAGARLIDHHAFTDPRGARTAILVECGQHWLERTARVAVEVCLRLLRVQGMLEARYAAIPSLRDIPPRTVEVTEVVTATSDQVSFVGGIVGMEVVPHRGTVVGYDGDAAITTPHDDCVLIMPSRSARIGQTAVRFGRLVEF